MRGYPRRFRHRRARAYPDDFYLLEACKRLDELRDLFKRLDVLAEYRILPYLMRHERYENDEYRAIYVDLARWLNQPGFFKKLSFLEFAEKAGSRKTRSTLASNELAPLKPWLERRFWK